MVFENGVGNFIPGFWKKPFNLFIISGFILVLDGCIPDIGTID